MNGVLVAMKLYINKRAMIMMLMMMMTSQSDDTGGPGRESRK